MGKGYAFQHWQLLAPSFFLMPAFSGSMLLEWCYSCEARAAAAFRTCIDGASKGMRDLAQTYTERMLHT